MEDMVKYLTELWKDNNSFENQKYHSKNNLKYYLKNFKDTLSKISDDLILGNFIDNVIEKKYH